LSASSKKIRGDGGKKRNVKEKRPISFASPSHDKHGASIIGAPDSNHNPQRETMVAWLSNRVDILEQKVFGEIESERATGSSSSLPRIHRVCKAETASNVKSSTAASQTRVAAAAPMMKR